MNHLLRKLKLIQDFHTELQISKSDFVNKLKNHVDDGDTGALASMFDAFTSSENDFKGHVSHEGFKIRRYHRLFDMNMALVTGSFTEHNGRLQINAEINSFSGFFKFYYIAAILIYGIFFVSIIASVIAGAWESIFFLLFLLFHAALLLGIPILVMRGSTKKMKRVLERDFFYFTK